MKYFFLTFLLSFCCINFLQAQNINQIQDTLKIEMSDMSVHAVLSKPPNGENLSVALIVAGSGPTDLNGNQPGMENNCLKYLSDALVEQNIATLRFDKRGVAQSAYPQFSEKNLTIDQYANDVKEIVSFLQEKGFRKIFLIGHSEGSLISLIAMQNMEPAGFISVAGAGNSADVVLKNQLKPKLPPTYYPVVEAIIDSLENGDRVKNVPPQLNMLFRPSVQPYLMSWFGYKPVDLLQKVHVPVVIIQGEKDIQVDTTEAQLLASAKEKVNLIQIEKMNHVLKTIEGGIEENMNSYGNSALEINQELINVIVSFIKNRD